jgi:hypothetical protein
MDQLLCIFLILDNTSLWPVDITQPWSRKVACHGKGTLDITICFNLGSFNPPWIHQSAKLLLGNVRLNAARFLKKYGRYRLNVSSVINDVCVPMNRDTFVLNVS